MVWRVLSLALLTACGGDLAEPVAQEVSGGTGGSADGGVGGSFESSAGATGGTGITPRGGAGSGGQGAGARVQFGAGNGGASGGVGDVALGGTAGSPVISAGSGGTSSKPGPPPDGTGFNVQAFSQIFLGETGWDGTVSTDGDDWQDFGFDIDGDHFTDKSQATYHCKLSAGGDPSDEILDGVNGVDNSFGRNIVPLLQSFAATPSSSATDVLQSGQLGITIQLAKLGAENNYAGLIAQVFFVRGQDSSGGTDGPSVAVSPTQAMTGSYVWHPFGNYLQDAKMVDPALYQATTQFPASSMTEDLWVSNGTSDFSFELDLADNTFLIPIHRARFQLQYAADHDSGTRGMLGGVLGAEEFNEAIKEAAARISTGFCNGPTLPVVNTSITQAADMNLDGTQHSDQECDAISIGIGFATVKASLGAPAPARILTDPCAGGSGGSG